MDSDKIKKTTKELFTDSIWTLDLENFSTAKKRLFKLVKLIRIVLDDFEKKRMRYQCVALSYFCALAFVPLLAIIFGVTNGLGLADKISLLLFRIIPNNPNLVNTLLEKAYDFINIAKSGTVGLASTFAFVWTILWMMFQVERVFNNVWGIDRIPRKWYNRISIYFLTIILLPFVLVSFGFGIVSYSNVFTLIGLEKISEIRLLTKFIGWMALFFVTVFTFSIMYKFIPATFVEMKYAFRAALISGLVFDLFQFLYLQTQMFVSRLNAVYGVIAAVPLFLIWLNYSWQIVMYGAQLSYGMQNVDTYNIPDDITFRDVISSKKVKNEKRLNKR